MPRNRALVLRHASRLSVQPLGGVDAAFPDEGHRTPTCDNELSPSPFNVARKLRLRVPTRLVPNTSAWSPAKVPENPLATSWPPDSGRAKGSESRVCWLVRSSPFQVPLPQV